MKRLFSVLSLLLVASLGFGASLTMTCLEGQSTPFVNVPQSIPTIATENSVIVQVKAGYPVTLNLSDTQAWIYRATTAVTTNDQPVAANQVLKLEYTQNTTFFALRSTVDGSLTVLPLAVRKATP